MIKGDKAVMKKTRYREYVSKALEMQGGGKYKKPGSSGRREEVMH